MGPIIYFFDSRSPSRHISRVSSLLIEHLLVSVNFKDLTLTEDFLQRNIQIGLLLNSRPRDGDLHKKSLKVFRLKAAILGLQFVKSMMFNCSYFDKSILNVYSPMSPKMFLGPAVGQRSPPADLW